MREHFPGEPLRIHKARIDQLVKQSRTAEGARKFNDDFFTVLDTCGILSLSTHKDNMLLWSYYAEGHRGIAMRLNTTADYLARIPGGLLTIPVKYCTELPRIDFYNSTKEERIFGILGTKAAAWAHEAEWRLVLDGRIGYIDVPPGMIDGVILGWRIEDENEATIRSWVKARSVPTEILRIRHRPGSFELEAVPA